VYREDDEVQAGECLQPSDLLSKTSFGEAVAKGTKLVEARGDG